MHEQCTVAIGILLYTVCTCRDLPYRMSLCMHVRGQVIRLTKVDSVARQITMV